MVFRAARSVCEAALRGPPRSLRMRSAAFFVRLARVRLTCAARRVLCVSGATRSGRGMELPGAEERPGLHTPGHLAYWAARVSVHSSAWRRALEAPRSQARFHAREFGIRQHIHSYVNGFALLLIARSPSFLSFSVHIRGTGWID